MPKGLKIPKKIAGVKLPKQARKTARKAIRMGASPLVREIAVAAIGAAGGKAMGDRTEPRADGQGSGHRRAEIRLDPGKVGEAFRAAAIDGLRRFLEGFEEGLRNIGEAVAPDDEKPKPNPKPARVFPSLTESFGIPTGLGL
jgi:hypothetical protein